MLQESPESSGDRHCGSCTVCCICLPFPEGAVGPHSKLPGEPCRHVGALGCRRYDRRPSFCGALACGWLERPDWPANWRPDRSGVICLWEQRPEGLWATVFEHLPGALTCPTGTEILEAIAQTASRVTTFSVFEGIVRPTALWQIEPLPATQRKAS